MVFHAKPSVVGLATRIHGTSYHQHATVADECLIMVINEGRGLSNQAWLSAVREPFAGHGHMCKPITLHSCTKSAQNFPDRDVLNMEEVLLDLDLMTELPSVEILVGILQKYRKEKNLAHAACAYTHICAHGLEAHRELGNYLVPMFVECGSVFAAHQVFHRLLHPKEYSWTSLIQGYVDGGEYELALNMLHSMREDCVEPSKYTFMALLKACALMKCLGKGQEIYNEVVKEGFELDCFLGNTVVDMFAKCSLLAEAQDVFDKLLVRDIVSWNALIAGYAENGFGDKALKCREQMQAEGLHLNEVTFLCSLKACGSIGAIHVGQELHAEIAREGLDLHPFVCNATVDMYAKCGCLADAQEVFDEILVHDIVSWTAIIAGYAEQGLGDEALMCLDKMLLEGVPPNAVTFICSLKACGSIVDISRGRESHNEIIKRGFEKDPFLGSSLVDMYAKCGLVLEAQEVFDELPVRDVVSWNALISGYAEHGLGEQGLKCLEEMQLEGLYPNASTFICSLKACSSIGAIEEGRKLHTHILKEGFDSCLTIGNSLVDMYAKCGSLAEAWEAFTELPPVQDVQPWSSLILGNVEHGESEKALILFAQMQDQGLLPNNVIFGSIVKACGNTAALETGRRIHSQVYRSEFFDAVVIALIDMYNRCGGMVETQLVFDTMPTMDLVKWTALITGYARQGETDLVLASFERMKKEGLHPNGITFLSVLSTCSHAGLVEKGHKYYEDMGKEYGITPTIKHYNCMVDLYVRAGQLDDAVAILEKMPVQPDHVTWSIVLGACKKWGDGKLGTQAFKCAVRLQERHPTPYIMMSNIFADAQMWEDNTKQLDCL